MDVMRTVVRRMMWLVLIGAAGGALWSWQRGRGTAPSPPTPPEWPPLATEGGVTSASVRASADTSTTIRTPDAVITPGDADDDTGSTDTSAGPGTSTPPASASVVNSLIDAPDARSGAGGTWVEPNGDGSCPLTHPIKANDNSGIYHSPGGTFYERTRAERCYASGEAATADGYRPAKS